MNIPGLGALPGFVAEGDAWRLRWATEPLLLQLEAEENSAL